MNQEANPAEATPRVADGTEFARGRIRKGPVPEWTTSCHYADNFGPEPGQHVTYLLIDRQINAEQQETFQHVALRLETMEAVAHESQWRLQFEPRTGTHTLHFIKVRRGSGEIDQLVLEKGHLLQREEGLNRLVIDGWFTFMIVLEDVRQGDILE